MPKNKANVLSEAIAKENNEQTTTDTSDKVSSKAAESKLDFQQVCLDVLTEKYAKGKEKSLAGNEMIEAVRLRVAKSLASNESHPKEYEAPFLHALKSGFIPGGRINSAAGADIRNATLINCFVQPVGDSISTKIDLS